MNGFTFGRNVDIGRSQIESGVIGPGLCIRDRIQRRPRKGFELFKRRQCTRYPEVTTVTENAGLLEQRANTLWIRKNAADSVRCWRTYDEKQRDCKQVQANAIPDGILSTWDTRCEGKVKCLVQGTAYIRRRRLTQSSANCGFFATREHRANFVRQGLERKGCR